MATGIILELSDVTAIISGINKLKERFKLATKNDL